MRTSAVAAVAIMESGKIHRIIHNSSKPNKDHCISVASHSGYTFLATTVSPPMFVFTEIRDFLTLAIVCHRSLSVTVEQSYPPV
jgi:hypothetical protein